jgi:hypothetical protein
MSVQEKNTTLLRLRDELPHRPCITIPAQSPTQAIPGNSDRRDHLNKDEKDKKDDPDKKWRD